MKIAKVLLLIILVFLNIIFNPLFITETSKATALGTITTAKPLTGAWLGSWPSPSQKNIEQYNQLSKQQSDIIETFVNTNQDITQWEDFLDYVKSQGAKNLLTLEMKKSDGTDYNTVDINNGQLDAYFTKLAKQMKSWQQGSEVWVMLMHEVNGTWYGWSIGDSQVNTNESYKAAYRRVVKIFRNNGANNVMFLYNVNHANSGKGASFMDAYPGDDYVDYVAIDGYNWGTSRSWGNWEGFRQIFDDAYNALASGSTRSVIITEVASTEIGGNKAAWITDMKKQIQAKVYSKLVAAIWLNENKETDWRIQSSASSLEAFQEK
ncbi:MAG TPA: glycosyl hydrolase [Desulfosporosinus sp.]